MFLLGKKWPNNDLVSEKNKPWGEFFKPSLKYKKYIIIRMMILRQDFLYGVGKRAWNSGFTGGMGKRGLSLPGLLYTGGIV